MLAAFVYFILPVILLMIGFPIYLILLTTSLVAVLFVADAPLTTIQTGMFGSLDSVPLLAIPFFILAGEIMGQGGIARRVIVWVQSLTGSVRGSLPVTTIVSSELFGAMSHTAVGTVAAVGRLVYPALKGGGYSDRFTVSLIASSGAIAVVIPPSIAMILYAMSAQQSAIALFTAGILPSLLLGLVDAIYVVLYSRSRDVKVGEKASWPKIWAATKEAGWALGAPFAILGGIYGGIFTPTEAAGVAVVYSVAVTMFIYRDISWRELWRITLAAVFLIAQILIIVTAAGIYSWLLTTSGIPQSIISTMNALHLAPWQTLLIVNIGLLLIGSFLEPPAAIIILTPLLLPVVEAAGVHPIHFGIIMAVNLSIGMYTPPFGLNLFASQAIFNQPLAMIYRGVVPFVLINFATLMLISYVPWISLGLLNVGR
ncbi:MAG: C4-dicarboxylate transporter, DctM subunit [Alphaproteobacteria bacterium]|jgi:C4-dicarboxylate transporter DctM subunit|nr:C4-dicarboxylate transporter, DctM subunit [Alphaproteobacteria bacterium]MEA2963000.1 C4-dicarboxylate transporter, DctM subunit [Alphaproteobacteria bacterium]